MKDSEGKSDHHVSSDTYLLDVLVLITLIVYIVKLLIFD